VCGVRRRRSVESSMCWRGGVIVTMYGQSLISFVFSGIVAAWRKAAVVRGSVGATESWRKI